MSLRAKNLRHGWLPRLLPILVFLYGGLLIFWVIAAKPAYSTVVDRVVAIVNQEVITLSELELAKTQLENPLFRELSTESLDLSKTPKLQETLRILIEKKLQLQAARKRGIMVDPEELKHVLDEIKQRQGIANDTTLQQFLAKNRLTLSDYTQEIKDRLTIVKLVNREILSSVFLQEVDVRAYYQAHLEQFRGTERVRLAQILLSIPQDAQNLEVQNLEKQIGQIRSQLLEGTDFAEIATRYSTGTKLEQEGDLGYFKKGELMKEIEDVVFTLEIGVISPVIRTPQGFHIFKVVEKQSSEITPYEEVKAQIEERLILERTEMAYRQWLKRLRDQAYVELKM